ncbi:MULTISPECIES: ECF-type riboflavin transporter substrate-binding protein [Bacillaceae]|uniref:ECF-type riboflavin transporter substrate-binding protein n=1 Tax=Bacillaceae TaxID=186817 RepID=UPI001F1C97AC|nr:MULTISPECIES: ECF-type riboflavin transporter substrate-binding protein [Bacillaceae]MCF2649345.1 ECF-type riboflavin transporter substrate-binding protein [Niallia circulans]CAI9393166.1 hypothetical protein BACSP_03452 [Bacillus sp. T2.9-1]
MGRKTVLSTKNVVAIGIGAAVFIIIGRFAAIPTGVPNTSFETSYAFLALMSVVFGPVVGGLIGFIGHALKDILVWGSPWWSWIIVSGIVGVGFGLAWKKINIKEGIFGWKQILTFNVVQIIVQAIGWFVLAPLLDVLIYAEPINKVILQGLVAGGLNIATVAVLGTLLIYAYSKTISKTNSLEKEETF